MLGVLVLVAISERFSVRGRWLAVCGGDPFGVFDLTDMLGEVLAELLFGVEWGEPLGVLVFLLGQPGGSALGEFGGLVVAVLGGRVQRVLGRDPASEPVFAGQWRVVRFEAWRAHGHYA